MKKFINILLAAYIAFAACYPCTDRDVCADDVNAALESTVHNESSPEADICSPLCICNCCRSTINHSPDFSFVFYFPEMREFNSALNTHHIPTVPHSIWQPPRIS